MSTIENALLQFRREPNVGPPDSSFRHESSVSPPAALGEVERAWRGKTIPADAATFWAVCREASLVRDIDYGQWGLRLLNPMASAKRTAEEKAERPSEFREGDLVIGEFIGDLELLLIAPSEPHRIIVVDPLDSRAEWYRVAADLGEFLEAYYRAGGDKYWERRLRG